MKAYSLGFLFNGSGDAVVLIRKSKPAWQAGRLNGIGGKMEPYEESPLQTMFREGREEMGVAPDWSQFGEMVDGDAVIFLFRAFDDGAFDTARTMEAEPIEKVLVSRLGPGTLPNVSWLIGIARDLGVSCVRVTYFSAA